MNGSLIAVYVLRDEHGQIRYVGVSRNPESRMKRHIREAKERKTHRHRWIMSMVERGLRPTMEVVEWTRDWSEAERRWVAKCKADGCDLVNGNDGGLDMRQARAKSESYPNIKRAYRMLESCLRAVKHYGSKESVERLDQKIERVRQSIARARKEGRIAAVDAAIGERFARCG